MVLATLSLIKVPHSKYLSQVVPFLLILPVIGSWMTVLSIYIAKMNECDKMKRQDVKQNIDPWNS